MICTARCPPHIERLREVPWRFFIAVMYCFDQPVGTISAFILGNKIERKEDFASRFGQTAGETLLTCLAFKRRIAKVIGNHTL